MVQQAVKVKNGMGLHARPAALIIKEASQFKSDIKLVKGQQDADAKSILGILSLAVQEGEEILVQAQGVDADVAVKSLVSLVNSGF